MSALVQSITMKVESNNEEALEEVKRLKAFLGGKGVTVRAFWAIEAGAESGLATVAMEFPNAAAGPPSLTARTRTFKRCGVVAPRTLASW